VHPAIGVQARSGGARGGQQGGLQVGAMQGEIRSAVALFGVLAQRQHPELAAVGAVAHAQPRRRHRQLLQLAGQQPPLAQDAGGVGPELDPGAHFGEAFRLLEQACLPAGSPGRQRRGEPGDAGPRDE
jgi:hypothetical protein